MVKEMDWAAEEETFLNRLSEAEPDRVALWNALRLMDAAGETSRARVLGEMMRDTLAEKGDTEGALETVRLMACCAPPEPSARRRLADALVSLLGGGADPRALVESAGFLELLPVAEAFRRLALLRALTPGALCYDRTWGAGVVRKSDPFYRRLTIDFEEKNAHEMAFAYAAETLALLDEDHLLARWRRDPEGVRALCAEDPAEAVRLALRSFGPLTAAGLQEHVAPRILSEAEWKSFWAAARGKLKRDPLVEFPGRRADPLRLLEREKVYDAAWFASWSGERDPLRILERVEEYLAADRPPPPGEAQAKVLIDRLRFVIQGAQSRHPGRSARAMLAASALAETLEAVAGIVSWDAYLDGETLSKTLRDLPARDIGRFLETLWRGDPLRCGDLLLRLLPELHGAPLNESIERLVAGGREEDAAALLRGLVEEQEAGGSLLYWMVRHPDQCDAWTLGSEGDRVRLMLRAIAAPASGEALKTQNQLRALFHNRAWVAGVLRQLEPSERAELMRSVREGEGWDSVERRSALAAMVKAFPELEQVMIEPAASRPPRPETLYTSERSYQERREQLRLIVQQELPRIAREIGIARSYGDLRENFEYKAAKDKQALLLRRRAELEAQLSKVRPSDFSSLPADNRAGPGTGVLVEREDGRQERFHILGMWDRDESLGIISSDSRVARALMGLAAGEETGVEEDGARFRVIEVTPLPDEVRRWIRGD